MKQTFCRLLLIKCRDEFENRLKASERFNQKPSATRPSSKSLEEGQKTSGTGGADEDEEEQRSIAKSKMLGNIKFICELGKQGLVQENILHLCIRQLVSKKKEEKIENKAQDLECLCQIMKTVGRILDTEKAQKLTDQYFERITFYSVSPELPARIRFMLKDVLELRENKWVPRRVQRETAPKTIGQIREEAAKDLGLPNFWDPSNMMGAAGIPGIFSSPFGPLSHSRQIYGHQPLMGSHDDMAYYGSGGYGGLGTGPGVIQEQGASGIRNSTQGSAKRQNVQHQTASPPLNPMLQPGFNPMVPSHMPYRGSSSQGSTRDLKTSRKQEQGSVGSRSIPNLPPRLQQKNQLSNHHQQPIPVNMNPNLASAILYTAGRGQIPPLNPHLIPTLARGNMGQMSSQPMEGGDISLRPSMPLIKPNFNNRGYSVQDSPSKMLSEPSSVNSNSSRSSPNLDGTSSNNAKNSSQNQQPNQKEIILKKTDEAIEALISEETNVDQVVSKLKDLKIPKK